MAKLIKTISQLKSVIKDGDFVRYVRWSRGFAMDVKQGYSRDYSTGAVHSGLSAVEIDDSWADDDIKLAKRMTEYIASRLSDAKIGCHIYEGVEVGKDSDGYSSITKIEHVATLSNSLVDLLHSMAVSHYKTHGWR